MVYSRTMLVKKHMLCNRKNLWRKEREKESSRHEHSVHFTYQKKKKKNSVHFCCLFPFALLNDASQES